jgi:CheY-like chemotaxis protein
MEQRVKPIQGQIDPDTFFHKTVLIVEDDFYNAKYLKEILANTGLTIIHTAYGKEAVDIALKQSIDIVLMDILLPDIDGYEATSRIKQSKPAMKIIAQTAYALPEEKEKAISAGCIDYISKPIKKEMLLLMMHTYLSSTKPENSSS